MVAHCARTNALAAGLFISPRGRGKSKRRGREREQERNGLLEAEHDPAVIKEMNGYRGADFFYSSFFSGCTTRSATSVHPSVRVRSVSLISAAYTQGVRQSQVATARSHRRHAIVKKINTQTRLIWDGYNNYSSHSRAIDNYSRISGRIFKIQSKRYLFRTIVQSTTGSEVIKINFSERKMIIEHYRTYYR